MLRGAVSQHSCVRCNSGWVVGTLLTMGAHGSYVKQRCRQFRAGGRAIEYNQKKQLPLVTAAS